MDDLTHVTGLARWHPDTERSAQLEVRDYSHRLGKPLVELLAEPGRALVAAELVEQLPVEPATRQLSEFRRRSASSASQTDGSRRGAPHRGHVSVLLKVERLSSAGTRE